MSWVWAETKVWDLFTKFTTERKLKGFFFALLREPQPCSRFDK